MTPANEATKNVEASLSDTNIVTFLKEYLALESSAEQPVAVDVVVLVVP